MVPAYLALLLLVVLPLLPIWMRSVFRRSALLDNKVQVAVFVGFQCCLAISVFLSFFLAWFTFSITRIYLAPYLTGLHASLEFWDAPLTPRGFVFVCTMIGAPFFVFTKVGLVSIRDAHQISKEQRDRLTKRKKSGSLWKGF